MIRHFLAMALVLGATAVPASAAPPGSPPPGHAPPPDKPRAVQVTLITGDRLTVTIQPGRRDRIAFEKPVQAVTSYADGHTYVVPAAAAAAVRSGRVDRSLFDITTLVAEGNSETVPVIVHYTGTRTAATAKARTAPLRGASAGPVLTSLGARAARVNAADDFWRSLSGSQAAGIERVSLDRKVRVSTDQSVPQIGAPAAWQRGLTGKGVRIAVLDTGIDAGHPDLKGRIAAAANFTEAPDSTDRQGHGTHVAGTIAGTGAASDGKYKGVAPDATLLNGKVLDDEGWGSQSGIISGMEWAVQQQAEVVNLSLGTPSPSDGRDPLSQALNQLSRTSGTLFVVAAGNCSTTAPARVGSPAAADEAVAVGNLTRDGELSHSSCRGPRAGDGALKPQLSAPGTGIVAPRAAGTELGDPVGEHYTTLTGTSMATPHVAGVAALIAQANPDWKAPQLRTRLISTADPQRAPADAEGAGRVDADQATASQVTVDHAELSLGLLKWPYPVGDEVSRELTYTNSADTAVTLDLAATGHQAAIKLSASKLTIEPKTSAKLTVTVERGTAGPGRFAGRILATAPGADPVVTSLAWSAESEKYELTVFGIDQEGRSVSGVEVNVAKLDGEPAPLDPAERILQDGKVVLRVPPGRYVVSAVFLTDATDTVAEGFALVASDELAVSASGVTATLDARKARPVDIAPKGRPDLISRNQQLSYSLKSTLGYSAGYSLTWNGTPQLSTATPTGIVTTGSAEFTMAVRYEVPPYELKAGGHPLEVRDFLLGPRVEGHWQLQVADAGTGQPDELAAARGKLAVIAWRSDDERPVGNVVKLAQDAGAKGALVYNPDAAGIGALRDSWVFIGDSAPTIPTVRASRATARELLRHAAAELTGRRSSPIVYDLNQSWPDRIPPVGRVAVGPAELATVRESFGSHLETMPFAEVRSARTPDGYNSDPAPYTVFPAPAERTAYVQTTTARWFSDVLYNQEGGPAFWFASTVRKFRPGEQARLQWMAPVYTSGLPAGQSLYYGIERQEDGLLFQVSQSQHGHEQDMPFGNQAAELVLERNGEEIARTADTATWVQVPADAAEYRAKLSARTEGFDAWKYSTRVDSTWTWKSRGGDQEKMPVVFADIDLPTADAHSRVPVGKPVPLLLGFRHQTGSTGAAFTSASLEISYDRQTWIKVPLVVAGGGKYKASITHPQEAAGTSPSIRFKGADAAGGSVEQDISNAFGLTE